ncbi:response regulator [Paenibacillus ginsengarvi]|uniref:Response regulator n=1 Tax=Paenibacillus ginsengarvi TaxID=400777 RepID=A0A3B0CNX1_9BACL|nr:response regulator [Paenibacillus ginsengarvi]RKN85546.1 response regulator [Paenibacillus ginsengarvi]
MWKVLLVEDESFVRRTLRQLIRWEEMGFTIAGEAGDGREALAMMKSDPPDLVIADIIMPAMDGIELLKRSREEGLESAFVMLTCMNEFEYARQALEFGASGYLLKLSMNVKSLGEALAKVDRELTRTMQIRSQADSQKFQRLYRHYWRSIYGGEAGGTEEAGELAAEESLPYASIWIASFLHGSARFTLDDFRQLGLACAGSRTVMHTYAHLGQTTVFVWNPASAEFRQTAKGEGLPWPAAFSEVVAANRAKEAWREVLRALDGSWYGGRAGSGSAFAGDRSREDEPYPEVGWKTEREWIQSFERRNIDEFRERLRDGWADMERRRLPMAIVKETAVRLDRILARIAGCAGQAEEELGASVTHSELGERLLERARQYALRWSSGVQPVTGHPEIDKALAFIHRHSHEDVTLKGIASLVAMDEAYFSGLFKKKTGVTLIHYVQQVRVGHAKKLLDETSLPVAEVGERVGFPNTNYFIKIFKRWTERTPNEYRLLEGAEGEPT